jgi:hypothetical protein
MAIFKFFVNTGVCRWPIKESDHGISANILSRTRILTLHGLAKIFDLAEEELLCIPNQRSLRQSDIDPCGDSF